MEPQVKAWDNLLLDPSIVLVPHKNLIQRLLREILININFMPGQNTPVTSSIEPVLNKGNSKFSSFT